MLRFTVRSCHQACVVRWQIVARIAGSAIREISWASTASALPPDAISCLGAFRTPAGAARGQIIVAGVRKPAQDRTHAPQQNQPSLDDLGDARCERHDLDSLVGEERGDGPGPSPQAGFGSRMRLSLSSFVEPHFLHARVRSSNFQLNRIGLIRRMTISVPQLGHADDASASGGVSGTAT